MKSYFENKIFINKAYCYPFAKGIFTASSSTALRLFLGVPTTNIFKVQEKELNKFCKIFN